MEPFKNLISPELVRLIAAHINRALPSFDAHGFCASAIPRLDALEMKARVAMLADVLIERLPTEPQQRNAVLSQILHPDRIGKDGHRTDEHGIAGWGIWPLTTIVGRTGLHDFDASLALLREMTMRHTAEFDVRPFLIADQARALSIMSKWVMDDNHHVRRLVSEGTRPRLPWGVRLPSLMADPSPVLPLLKSLRDDPSDYVRRSVANHLNDISRDHPDLVVSVASEWSRRADKQRMGLLRHACRSLIKAGQPDALALFGFGPARVQVGPVRLSHGTVSMGQTLAFSATLRSTDTAEQTLSIDFVIHFMKANGTTAPKVFKGGTMTLAAGEAATFTRRHRFRPVTTRRHYAGRHALALRINGVDTEPACFDLQCAAGSA